MAEASGYAGGWSTAAIIDGADPAEIDFALPADVRIVAGRLHVKLESSARLSSLTLILDPYETERVKRALEVM